ANQPEAVRTEEHNIVAAVVQLLDTDQLPDAADGVEGSLIVVVEPVRLDHRNPPRTVDRILDHLPVARLENMQRQLRSREEDRAGKREKRNSKGPAHVNRT